MTNFSELLVSSRVLILAHRGLVSPGGPHENSRAAFAQALAAGADVIETDIQLTFDGIPVVFHDADLNRLTGKNLKVSGLKLPEFGRILESAGMPLLTLEEALVAFPDAFFNLDVKARNGSKATAEIVNRLGAQNRVLITSFSEIRRQATVRQVDPVAASSASASRLLLIYALVVLRLGVILPLLTKDIQALQIPRKAGLLRFDKPRFIRAVQAAGLQVHYWTINSPDEMLELIELGANGLVTDRCDLAVNIRDAAL